MTPGDYDLDLYRGDSYRWQFQLWADAGKTQPVDLTGCTVKAEIRDKPRGTVSAVITTAVDTTPGVITASLSATTTAGLIPSGAWDLQVTYPDGEVRTVLAGKVTVTDDVTDSTAALLLGVTTVSVSANPYALARS